MGWLRKRYPIKATIVHAPDSEFSFPKEVVYGNVAKIKVGPMRKKATIILTDGNVVHIDDQKPFVSFTIEKPTSSWSRWVSDTFRSLGARLRALFRAVKKKLRRG